MRRPHSGATTLPFAEPDRPTGSNYVANVDGASRGNPGPASYAVIVRAPDGKIVFEIGKYLGRATNNVAEYYGLITALDYAQSQSIARLLVRTDSELMVRQMQGRYKVKSPDLRPLYERARKLAGGLAHFAIEHIPRELNSAADELANIALDKTGTHQPVPAAPAARPESSANAPTNAAPNVETNARTKTQTKTPAPASETMSARTLSPVREMTREIARPATPTGQSAPENGQRIRARYSAGALHPMQPLDLYEGEIVEIQIAKPAQKPGR